MYKIYMFLFFFYRSSREICAHVPEKITLRRKNWRRQKKTVQQGFRPPNVRLRDRGRGARTKGSFRILRQPNGLRGGAQQQMADESRVQALGADCHHLHPTAFGGGARK